MPTLTGRVRGGYRAGDVIVDVARGFEYTPLANYRQHKTRTTRVDASVKTVV